MQEEKAAALFLEFVFFWLCQVPWNPQGLMMPSLPLILWNVKDREVEFQRSLPT